MGIFSSKMSFCQKCNFQNLKETVFGTVHANESPGVQWNLGIATNLIYNEKLKNISENRFRNHQSAEDKVYQFQRSN